MVASVNPNSYLFELYREEIIKEVFVLTSVLDLDLVGSGTFNLLDPVPLLSKPIRILPHVKIVILHRFFYYKVPKFGRETHEHL
jgi:hypothetical protein